MLDRDAIGKCIDANLAERCDFGLRCRKVKVVSRWIDRFPNLHVLEVWREKASQIFFVLKLIFVERIAFLAVRGLC